MKTAEEFLNDSNLKTAYSFMKGVVNRSNKEDNQGVELEKVLIEFAKMHVTEALKQVIEGTDYDRQSILNAYPLDQIK